MVLTQEIKDFAIKYVAATGFYKNRLAGYLCISRPTLDKILEEDPQFFTQLKSADALFCKDLIVRTAKKNPAFILKTKYKEEFDDSTSFQEFDPEMEIKRLANIIDQGNSDLKSSISS